MDYDVSSRILVKLYSGKVFEAETTAMTNQSAGRKGTDPLWQRNDVGEPGEDHRSVQVQLAINT